MTKKKYYHKYGQKNTTKIGIDWYGKIKNHEIIETSDKCLLEKFSFNYDKKDKAHVIPLNELDKNNDKKDKNAENYIMDNVIKMTTTDGFENYNEDSSFYEYILYFLGLKREGNRKKKKKRKKRAKKLADGEKMGKKYTQKDFEIKNLATLKHYKPWNSSTSTIPIAWPENLHDYYFDNNLSNNLDNNLSNDSYKILKKGFDYSNQLNTTRIKLPSYINGNNLILEINLKIDKANKIIQHIYIKKEKYNFKNDTNWDKDKKIMILGTDYYNKMNSYISNIYNTHNVIQLTPSPPPI